MPNGIFTLKQVNQALRQGLWVTGIKTPAVDYLVVAGGGSGNDNFNDGGPGGGGAGGLLQGNLRVAQGSAITVTIGAGGTGVYNAGASTGASGNNSVFGSILAAGGGGGSSNGGGATSGGSGGGGGGTVSVVSLGAQGIFNQGNAGGRSSATGTEATSGGGGGGGAGTVGLDGTSGSGGNGGAGIASAISGTVTAYAGGGGAGNFNGTRGVGGAGGGGNGGNQVASQTPSSGAVNTGGGGGGGGGRASGAASGGSGIVVISYPDTYQAPTATTGSPTVSTSGSGSIAFNGTNQYLTYPSSTNYAFGTGDFTVEMYIYRSNTSALILDARSAALAETWAMYCNATKLAWYTGPLDVSTPSDIPLNSWAHIAVCRSGTTTRLFINGNLETSFTDITNYTTTSTLKVGVIAGLSSNFFSGNMSNIRITKGVALYTASFTPSAAPLSASASTGLLLNTVSGSVFADATGNTTISSAVNSPDWSQLSPFATGLGFKNRVYTWTSSGSITF
jgi:hypothetical protein